MNTIDFLRHFESNNSKIEFVSILDGKINVVSKEEALNNKEKNYYYLGGVKKDLVYENGIRAKDDDIIEKNYFCLDLDLAKNFEEEFGDSLDYEDIIKEAENIVENLKYEDEYFGEFSFVVVSGGGLHIYYCGDFKEFTKEEYSLGVNRIYKQWNKIMGSKSYEVDFACKNIGRIFRLPGSINQKNGKECKIIYGDKKESRLFNLIKGFAIKEQEEKEEQKRIREIEIKSQIKNFNKGENVFYEKINLILSYQIAEMLIPDFPFDGKKNFKNKKGGFTGYYYVKETNTICNGGSRYFNWGDESSCWNNFSLVKQSKDFTNKEVFDFFKLLLK